MIWMPCIRAHRWLDMITLRSLFLNKLQVVSAQALHFRMGKMQDSADASGTVTSSKQSRHKGQSLWQKLEVVRWSQTVRAGKGVNKDTLARAQFKGIVTRHGQLSKWTMQARTEHWEGVPVEILRRYYELPNWIKVMQLRASTSV